MIPAIRAVPAKVRRELLTILLRHQGQGWKQSQCALCALCHHQITNLDHAGTRATYRPELGFGPTIWLRDPAGPVEPPNAVAVHVMCAQARRGAR